MLIETFLKKAVNTSGKVSASAFIKEHRNFLCSFPRILPILVAMDQGKMFPTPALEQIVTLMAVEKDPAKAVKATKETVQKDGTIKVEKVPSPKKPPMKYLLFLYLKDSNGNEYIDGEKNEGAEEYGDAEHIAHLRLFRREDSTKMEIIGMGISTFVSRDDAIRSLMGRQPGKPGAFCKTEKKGGGSGLGWKPSAKNYVAKFSRG